MSQFENINSQKKIIYSKAFRLHAYTTWTVSGLFFTSCFLNINDKVFIPATYIVLAFYLLLQLVFWERFVFTRENKNVGQFVMKKLRYNSLLSGGLIALGITIKLFFFKL